MVSKTNRKKASADTAKAPSNGVVRVRGGLVVLQKPKRAFAVGLIGKEMLSRLALGTPGGAILEAEMKIRTLVIIERTERAGQIERHGYEATELSRKARTLQAREVGGRLRKDPEICTIEIGVVAASPTQSRSG